MSKFIASIFVIVFNTFESVYACLCLYGRGTPGSVAMSETEASIIRSAGMVTPTFRTRGRDPHFLSLEFVGGTPCDLDTVNRTTVVDMYCGAK